MSRLLASWIVLCLLTCHALSCARPNPKQAASKPAERFRSMLKGAWIMEGIIYSPTTKPDNITKEAQAMLKEFSTRHPAGERRSYSAKFDTIVSGGYVRGIIKHDKEVSDEMHLLVQRVGDNEIAICTASRGPLDLFRGTFDNEVHAGLKNVESSAVLLDVDIRHDDAFEMSFGVVLAGKTFWSKRYKFTRKK